MQPFRLSILGLNYLCYSFSRQMFRANRKLIFIKFSISFHTLLFFQLFTFSSNLKNEDFEKYVFVWLIICITIMLSFGYFGGIAYFIWKMWGKAQPLLWSNIHTSIRDPNSGRNFEPEHPSSNHRRSDLPNLSNQIQNLSSKETLMEIFLNSSALQIVLFTSDMLVPVWSLLLMHMYLTDTFSTPDLDLKASVIVQLVCISTLIIINASLAIFKTAKLR
jgi:hypothetical protein